jgi:type III restriction enzyme
MTTLAPKELPAASARQRGGLFQGRRDALHQLADEERRAGSPYLRPLILIQSEPRRAGVETLDVERVHKKLITNRGIPASEIEE